MGATTMGGHLIPDSDAAYDFGNASNKIRHLFLSNNSVKFGDAELALGVDATAGTIQFNTHTIATSTTEVNDTTGALDITKRNHFVTPGVNYTLADGTYTGQELHIWKSGLATGVCDITIANAIHTNAGDVTAAVAAFVWRLTGAQGRFSCIWNGTQWIIGDGGIAA